MAAWSRPSTGWTCACTRARSSGLVGESGSGKSITGFSVIGLIDPPGRIVGGHIRYLGEELVGATEARLQRLRGKEIAMIFQDPMMTLNPVLRVDTQMVEAIHAHEKVSAAAALDRAPQCAGHGRHSRRRKSGCWPIRTSFRAACASAWRSPSPC